MHPRCVNTVKVAISMFSKLESQTPLSDASHFTHRYARIPLDHRTYAYHCSARSLRASNLPAQYCRSSGTLPRRKHLFLAVNRAFYRIPPCRKGPGPALHRVLSSSSAFGYVWVMPSPGLHHCFLCLSLPENRFCTPDPPHHDS